MNTIYPATIDEIIAEQENTEFLNEDKMTPVSPNDDDYVHLLTHNKAADTKSKAAHIHAHKVQIMIKRKQPELFKMTGQQPDQKSPQGNEQPMPTTVNPLKVTPSETAAPTTPLA